MPAPLYVRPLSTREQAALDDALRSDVAFTMRRAQILRLSAQGQRSGAIAEALGCWPQTVRNAIRDFNNRSTDSLQPKKSGPKTPERIFDDAKRNELLALAHQSPRAFSKPRSTWTLALLAEVAVEDGLTDRLVSPESIRQAILAMGHSWARAKAWIQSPDPQDALKKQRDRLIHLATHTEGWTLGFLDEVWWSRFAQPKMHAWAPPERPVRLVQRDAPSDDEAPKALACYGVYLPGAIAPAPDLLLRFVKGRPTSDVTIAFLRWGCEKLAERSVRVWALVWDRASWHLSHKVRRWMAAHNRAVKRAGGVRILACDLPSKSPWLNPIEPKWLHGKRAVCEPDGTLSPEVLIHRIHAYYGCEPLPPLEQETA